MKKAYPFLLSLFIALCLLPAAAFAQKVTINKINYSIDETSGTASVVSGNQTNGRIEIPDTITVEGKKHPVTVIGANAFDRYRTQSPRAYQEIIIGANVTTIESYAFSDAVDYIQKIQFNGDKCQTIASTAFDWMLFSKNPPFQLIVCGPQGCMDEVLKGVVDLKDKEILYQDPNAGEITKALQKQIDGAQAGTETAITIDKDYALTETLTVPAGKIIVLRDDGAQHTLSQAPVNDPGEMFKVEKGASLTFDGDLIFKGGESKYSDQGNIVNVSGEFTLKRGKLHGGKISGPRSAAVLVNKNAKFTMTGGSIEAFTITSAVSSAPVVVGSSGYFDMSGGRISGNKVNASGSPNCSGGVLLWTWQPNDLPAKMYLSGEAVIDGNSAPQGGGIYLIGKTELNMSGGRISNNEATRHHGGGVCVAGQSGGNTTNKDVTSFTMTGGVIEGNSAAKSGGGIYVNSDDVTLSGGKIINNEAREWGGGVYVSVQPHTLRLTNVVINQNKAKVMGGGIWICPTGSLEVHITNGGAIFDNATDDPASRESAGADIAFVGNTKNDGRKLKISRRMLGGGRNVFYKDGGIIQDTTLGSVTAGGVDTKVPRFDPADPGEEVLNPTAGAGCALISKPSEGAKQLANEAAKLIISGNKASQGGGIGSNGGVVIGNEGEYSLKVNKAWAEDIPESSRCAVTIKLKIKGIALDGDTVVLDKGNNWSAEFTGLPQPPQLIDCTVIEDPLPAGFAPEVSEAVFNETDKSYTITVTNKKAPAPTPTPTPGGGYEPTPTPFIIVPPKTGDGGFFRMLLSFLGFGK